MKPLLHQILVYGLLCLLGAAFLVPFFWMVSTSLKAESQIFVFPPKWIPDPVLWSNYPNAVSAIPFWTYAWNTVFITGFNILGVLISSSLVAYSFARLRWPGRNQLFMLLLATMMLPGQVTMIPVFLLFKELGWVNTFLPLIVPAFFGNAFYIFLLRQFFLTIPVDLEDAARVDGCPRLLTYWHVILPLSKPALATVGVFTFMGTWNDFMGPLIYLSGEDKKTLALGLQSFVWEHGAEWSLLMAVSTMMLLPLLILFFLAQRYFIEGIALTGIKG
jgi:multiple sugar transport system permease protein